MLRSSNENFGEIKYQSYLLAEMEKNKTYFSTQTGRFYRPSSEMGKKKNP